MNNYAGRILRGFPVRRSAKEKEAFRAWLLWELKELGYHAALQSKESPLSFGGNVTNVVAGDPETARLLLVAHYDTGLRELFPPLIAPTRPVTYLLYLALTPVCVLLGSLLISFGVTFALNAPQLTLPLFLLLLLAGLGYLRFGPGETANADDNSSGVAALLETAAALTPRYRGEAAFAFVDGMAGARALRSKYPSTREKTVVNVECVARGGELLILPSRYSRWNGGALDAILGSFGSTEEKTCFLKTDGLVYYPSVNRAFRYSFTICACEKLAGFGRIIRPRRAESIDEENLRLLREGLCKLIAKYQG